MEQMIDRMFQDMDTNRDGRISKSEWMAFQEKQFDLLDKNGDGFLTKDEVRTDMMERMRAQQQQQRGRPPQ
jgi:Ca2+-binding EF-hand superfamily protein